MLRSDSRCMNESGAYNIRYIGFESLAEAQRRLEYTITGKGMPARRVTVDIPGSAFSGPTRITFQESAAIGYEKVRREVAAGPAQNEPLAFVLTDADIEIYRPRRRAGTSVPKKA